MYFMFENSCKSTEALVTALKYDAAKSMYELTVLGIDKDGINYTQLGHAWFDDENFEELIKSDELEFPHKIIGRKIRFTANIIE